MARTVRQTLPTPPPVYDQAYIAKLADAVNRYMVEREALGELTAARFICVDPVVIPDDLPNTSTLPTGMLYLAKGPVTAGEYYFTIVKKEDL